jgi:chromosome segregation ATPase
VDEFFQEHFTTIVTTGGAIITAILSLTGGAVGWVARGRQRELEAEQTRVSTSATESDSAVRALNETFEQLKQMRADYRAHIAEMNDLRAAHRKHVDELESEIDKWREQHNELSMRHHEFRVQSRQLYLDYKALQQKFDEQRAELARFRALTDEDPPSEFLGRNEGDTPVLRREREEDDDWA